MPVKRAILDLFKKYVRGTEKNAVVQNVTILLCGITNPANDMNGEPLQGKPPRISEVLFIARVL